MSTQEFIQQFKTADIHQLALQAKRYPDVDMPFALQQIDGWQRAQKKLPLWARHDDILYPPHISMEQCSSEQTAIYKQSLCIPSPRGESKRNLLIDLTGGFGVDFSYMSQAFERAIYVEQQSHLCDIARHNFHALGLTNVEVINDTAENILQSPYLQKTIAGYDVTIYLDPARRDVHGRKTYAIADCTPDVTTLMPQLLQMASRIIIKLSPMLDHNESLRQLNIAADVHIVSVRNECKEVLLVIDRDRKDTTEGRLFCVNDDFVLQVANSTSNIKICGHIEEKTHLYIPNASIMKVGCFSYFAEKYGLEALDPNSHLFVSDYPVVINEAIARSFIIRAVTTMNKQDLRSALSGIHSANIACRNFPMTPQELRRKLRLKDGGTTYLFATTIAHKHYIILAEKTS